MPRARERRDYRHGRERERLDRPRHLDGPGPPDGCRPRWSPRLLPRRDRAGRDRDLRRRRAHGHRGSLGPAGHRAGRRPGRPAASPRHQRALPPGDPGPQPPRPGQGAPARGRGRLAPQRRLRPPGQRGPLPERSGGKRDRALPRPPPGRMAGSRRGPPDGHPAARPRRGARRAAARGCATRHAARHPHRPRPSQRRRPHRRRSLLLGRARLRRDGARLPRRPLRLGGWLPPPPRPQHLGRRGRPSTATR